ncbi:TetR/AcrR family transcriptional regulator [Micromonospora sp. NBC_01813]|uniref:TetR/AcrR family transcriptional regulator n=1 Tax=Micromonospora sp. NBC_01813 TaxID=2975988 RepID=UPI002DD94DD1|nr:TetR/AcrR family transcriptional regulator [Micromonospora sp. NBC_01813]WSA08974.1 TetR/AcrR family transcriptional regulator [Micromonospora sp. NBC_01813]
MASARALRERVRKELTDEIVEIAKAQLADRGAENLSLRAIARDLGMVSSAVYRYFPSRDDLLTALVIDGYNSIGAAVEQADEATASDDFPGRWRAVGQALRAWATEHPHEYALVYGSPVRGYHAPETTLQASMRDKVVLGRIISDAHRAGVLRVPPPAQPAPQALAGDLRRVREAVLPAVPDSAVVAALTAWSGLFGMLNLELFGHFNNIIDDRAGLFDQALARLADLAGLPA